MDSKKDLQFRQVNLGKLLRPLLALAFVSFGVSCGAKNNRSLCLLQWAKFSSQGKPHKPDNFHVPRENPRGLSLYRSTHVVPKTLEHCTSSCSTERNKIALEKIVFIEPLSFK